MLRAGFALSLLTTTFVAANLRAADAPGPATQPSADADQAALEEQFVKTMTNAEMVGRFTMEGNDKPPAEEHYTISSVKKLHGDLWVIAARIQFGTKDVTVPLILPVKWAGDTPIIEVTDMGIPGIGKYTARVLIYDDHYAGTWSGSPTHRGSLFGKIEHAPTTQPAK
jgi:hypothetical protein